MHAFEVRRASDVDLDGAAPKGIPRPRDHEEIGGRSHHAEVALLKHLAAIAVRVRQLEIKILWQIGMSVGLHKEVIVMASTAIRMTIRALVSGQSGRRNKNNAIASRHTTRAFILLRASADRHTGGGLQPKGWVSRRP